MNRFLGIPACFLLLMAVGCKQGPELDPAIGEAYVGPATLNLRRDLGLESAVVGTARHGERLEILQRRRRFVKVRTGRRAEGWTDERLLLSPDEVSSQRRLSEAQMVPEENV